MVRAYSGRCEDYVKRACQREQHRQTLGFTHPEASSAHLTENVQTGPLAGNALERYQGNAPIPATETRTQLHSTNAADAAFIAFDRDRDFLEDKVVFFTHFITRSNDQVSARRFDCLESRGGLDRTNRIKAQAAQCTTAVTTVSHTVGKLAIATELQETKTGC